MNALRKFFGLIWILLAPVALYFIVSNALKAFEKADKVIAAATDAGKSAAEAAKTNTVLQWSIIIVIFLPIALGLIIFGRYALTGEYNNTGGQQGVA